MTLSVSSVCDLALSWLHWLGSWDALGVPCVPALQHTCGVGSASLALVRWCIININHHLFEQIEPTAKPLNYFLWSNKRNINQRLHNTLVSRTVTAQAVILGGVEWKKGSVGQNWTGKTQPSTLNVFWCKQSTCTQMCCVSQVFRICNLLCVYLIAHQRCMSSWRRHGYHPPLPLLTNPLDADRQLLRATVPAEYAGPSSGSGGHPQQYCSPQILYGSCTKRIHHITHIIILEETPFSPFFLLGPTKDLYCDSARLSHPKRQP